MEKFTDYFTVTDNMTLANKEISPVGILDLFQTIAGEHVSILGYPYEKLKEMGYAFVLLRCKYKLYDKLFTYDKLKITTWPYKTNRVEFDRSFNVYKNDKLVITGLSKWVIIDLKTRKLVRPEMIDSKIFGNEPSEPFPKIKMPIELEEKKLPDYVVREDDTDRLLHFNNTKYMNVLLPREYSSLEINYLTEIRLNDVIKIFLYEDLTFDYYVGKINDTIHFIIRGEKNE